MPIRAQTGYNAYSPEVYPIIREVLHKIGDIDYQHDVEIDKADRNPSDEAVKNCIKQKIRAAHQRKRQPYVDLLNTLRSRLKR